jgi:SAM-dependent methyltransferase
MQVALDAALADIGRMVLDADGLIRAVAAGTRRGVDPPRWRRAELRPVDLRAGRRLQIVRYDERQAFTENVEYGPDAAVAVKELLAEPFGGWHVDTVDTTVQLRVTKKGNAQLHRAAASDPRQSAALRRDAGAPGGPRAGTKSPPAVEFPQDRPDHTASVARPPTARAHDRIKPRVLSLDDPMLYAVGITTADGAVKPSKRDKYRQVEEFLRALEPLLTKHGGPEEEATPPIGSALARQPDGQPAGALRVVDLGCGNAYLTFAAYSFLIGRGLPVELVGVDVKAQARERNTAIARRLGWSDRLRFIQGAIDDAQVDFSDGDADADLVLALHACDTATDDALARGIRWQAPVILAAPCCHHNIQAQLRRSPSPRPYSLVTRHGILRERFADVLTDALRAALLRLAGYRVEVVEFVPTQHTPRNVLIRAVRTGAPPTARLIEEYADLVHEWSVQPYLADLVADHLPQQLR